MYGDEGKAVHPKVEVAAQEQAAGVAGSGETTDSALS